MVLLALPDVREDAERRARGVTVEDWLAAPRPPKTRDACYGDDARAARCPALRCKYHLGRYGIAAGFACWLDVCELPEEERTFDLIGRVLGVTAQRAEQSYQSACNAVEQLDAETKRLLGVRRR